MIEHYVQGTPTFLKMHQHKKQYPYLIENLDTEVVVVGGGVTGAILSYYLTKNGIDTVVLEKKRIGHGSSCISTSLLQYELDENARALEEYSSLDNVVTSYKLGLKALDEVKKFIDEYGNKCDYEQKDTLLYTAKDEEKPEIEEEYRVRKDAGLKVKLIKPEDNLYDFDLKLGVYGEEAGASLNPYDYAHQLIDVSTANGAKIYENTSVDQVIYTKEGVKIITEYGYEVTAKKVILATGYETDAFTNKIFGQKSITYNVVTHPVESFEGWHNTVLIRDNEATYHYLRTTPDNRIIIGGMDTPYNKIPVTEEEAKKRYEALFVHLQAMFPRIRPISMDYGCCGVFDSTKDNLGIVGPDTNQTNLWYCLGYGANGILFAILGAMMLTKLYKGEVDEDLKLFSPDRFEGVKK